MANQPVSDQDRQAQLQRRHRRTALYCGIFVASMVGAAYAAVPLYDLFCRATGFGGTTQVAQAAPDAVHSRTVRVRFDANVAPGLDWGFRPVQREMVVRVGEANLAFFEARNRSGKDSWGTATYNVTPDTTGAYFNKIQCFCFDQQQLTANEKLDMPIQFFVDPSFLEDAEMDNVNTITLSYTFFAAQPPAKQAGLAKRP
ncbi:cytochrome c oxidase assembly protein [Terrihabitans sp. B22-R8]|uniref:cytochrome c oxidase assembly protein n=1 Tax=Terrihabitans sp. B22-R8 TaxID=3425128 RepID=UPI00403C9FE7